jgi:glycosyltransferase involved in cell wall biosynthesis
MPKSLLFIGFFDSTHFARWIENVLESTDYELTIFCSSPARRINPYLQRLISDNESRLRISKHSPKNPFFAYLIDKMPLVNQRSRALKSEILNRHDIIHYFEMQHSGYLLLPLISELRDKKVVYSNYGSDIFWFKKYRSHRRKMEKVLSLTDLVFYECERDLGFLKSHCPKTAEYVWTINSGGLRDIPKYSDSNDRDIVLIKGYSNKWGQGLRSLLLIVRARKIVKESRLRVVVYSADFHIPIVARLLEALYGFRIKTHAKGALLHNEVLDLMRKSIVHLAMSKSDGIPASTLEAMASGAIPIQSSSACMDSMIKNGVNGFIIGNNQSNLSQILNTVIFKPNFSSKARRISEESIKKFYKSNKIGESSAAHYKNLAIE